MNKTITGKIAAIQRTLNTPHGNPRWAISVGGETYNTKDDTQCNNLIDPWDSGREVTLTLDGNNQIIGYELGAQ